MLKINKVRVIAGLMAGLMAGAVITLLYMKYGFSQQLLPPVLYSFLLLIIAVYDWEKQQIPNLFIITGAILAVVFGIIYGGIYSTLQGGGLALVLMFISSRMIKIGMADVKLGSVCGLMVGFPAVAVAVPLSWILGLVVLGILTLLKVVKRKDKFPFGIFLSLATIITFLWGVNIWQVIQR